MERKHVTPTFKELKADLKGMSAKEKLDHLWTYYKYHLFLVLVAGVFVAAIISGAINASKNVLVHGMMANVSISQSGYNYLTEGYGKTVGAGKNDVVELTSTNFEDLKSTEDVEGSYNAAQILIARVSGALLDYALLDQMSFEFYLTQEVYMDLRECFTAEELEQLAQADMLAYAQHAEGGERWPVALKISSWDFVKDNVTTKGEIYFVVGGNDPDLDAVRGILQHMRDWKK